MALALETSAAKVKPTVAEPGYSSLRMAAGTGGTTAGAIVCVGTDGIVLADGSTGNAYLPIGIVLQTALVGETVDVVTGGPVNCVTGAAEGSEVYPTDGTAGTPTHTKSTKKHSVGVALSTTVVFVHGPAYVA